MKREGNKKGAGACLHGCVSFIFAKGINGEGSTIVMQLLILSSRHGRGGREGGRAITRPEYRVRCSFLQARGKEKEKGVSRCQSFCLFGPNWGEKRGRDQLDWVNE